MQAQRESCECFVINMSDLWRELDEWNDTPLDVAVIDNSGVGKSSYISAIRGLTADDEKVAEVGCVQTTTEPRSYPHPVNQMLLNHGGKDECMRQRDEWKETTLDVAVIGNSGVGKSSFINAIRGLTADGEGATEVDEVQTTAEPRSYPHSVNPMLKFWDLPGVRTSALPRASYLKIFGVNCFDFFPIYERQTCATLCIDSLRYGRLTCAQKLMRWPA